MDRTRNLEERLQAVERAVTEEDLAVASVEDAAELTARIETLESRLDTMEATLDETSAAISALRGYVGEIRHVNREVERTASAAIAAVERLDDASGTPPPIARIDSEPQSVPESQSVPEQRLPGEDSTTEDGRSILDRIRALL